MLIYRRLFALLVLISLINGVQSQASVYKESSATLQDTITNSWHSVAKHKISQANWVINEISDGIVHKYSHFDNLFDAYQSITLIEVDLNKKVKVDIPYLTEGFIKTSEAAVENNATAAVNGSYFDTKKGGSTVFFKKDAKIIKAAKDKPSSFRENVALAINAAGAVSIIEEPTSGWQACTIETILSSGPLLIKDGKIAKQLDKRFNINRHPRTAIGLTADNRLIAAVIDGRNAKAQGMSIEELTILMHSLGCIDALNLDGGGSSTAWIKGLGVVNNPSDNKKFDHNGERGVATVITFTAKK